MIAPFSNPLLRGLARFKHSASSSQWLGRQHKDSWTRQARFDKYKSRAAYKLKEIQKVYRIFRPGMTVVDLGFAPGSWSQVAVEYTKPYGKVVGVDLLPAEPPRGVSSLQGDFLSDDLKERLMDILQSPFLGRPRPQRDSFMNEAEQEARIRRYNEDLESTLTAQQALQDPEEAVQTVDVVLSDMLANTTGTPKDHYESMLLCIAALEFAKDTLRPGGSFVCKFYTGEDDRALEQTIRRVFKQVKRVKPEACRSESREMYFVALKKKKGFKKLPQNYEEPKEQGQEPQEPQAEPKSEKE